MDIYALNYSAMRCVAPRAALTAANRLLGSTPRGKLVKAMTWIVFSSISLVGVAVLCYVFVFSRLDAHMGNHRRRTAQGYAG